MKPTSRPARETFRYPSPPPGAVMQSRIDGGAHDTIQHQACKYRSKAQSRRRRARPPRGTKRNAHTGIKTAVAAAVWHAGAALQQALPAEPAWLPDPRTGARRLKAGNRGTA